MDRVIATDFVIWDAFVFTLVTICVQLVLREFFPESAWLVRLSSCLLLLYKGRALLLHLHLLLILVLVLLPLFALLFLLVLCILTPI